MKSGDFDVYMVGTEIIRVRTEDLKQMWDEIKRSPCTALWCDGLVDDSSGKLSRSSKSGRKRKRAASDEESDDVANQSIKTQKKVDNEIKVQEIVDSLKSKHGTKYSAIEQESKTF